MRIFYLDAFSFLFIHTFFVALGAKCPRSPPQQQVLNEDETETSGAQPGVEPAKQYIQTTFIHRDGNDDDREYAQFVRLLLVQLRPPLLALAHVTVDNENIDCSAGDGHPRCGEYPTEEQFHFLVVEDSRSGAAVYSIDRKRNWHAGGSRARTMARIEAALLDALSRHSVHPLTLYASESAANELGFVREVGVAELEQFVRQNYAKRSSASPSAGLSIFTRSPTELRLLNDRLLARRRVDFDPGSNPRGLIAFRGSELVEMIDAESVRTVFVLFWHEAIPLSAHSLELWSRASELWRQTQINEVDKSGAIGHVVLGSVACHEEDELCRAFAVPHTAIHHQQQLFAFRNGQRLAQQIGIGDEHFLVNWVRMILSDPLIRLTNADEIAAVRKGFLPGIESPRAAITVGTFRSEQQEEFRKFARVATLLHGRYSLAYWLDEKSDALRLSTFRQIKSGTNSSDLVEMPFSGSNFDVRPLLHHITHASLPDILDIGLGFSIDVPLSPSSAHSLLSLQNGTSPNFLSNWLAEIASELRLRQRSTLSSSRPLVLSIDLAHSLPLGKLLETFEVNALPALCLLSNQKHNFRCVMGEENVNNFTVINAPADFVRYLLIGKRTDDAFEPNGSEGRKGKESQSLLLTESESFQPRDKKSKLKKELPFRHFWIITLAWGQLLLAPSLPINSPSPHLDDPSLPPPRDPSAASHPLAPIQLEHINAMFGTQHIPLEQGMFSTKEQSREAEIDPHDFSTMDMTAMSGCPMMAHLNQQQMRDEL